MAQPGGLRVPARCLASGRDMVISTEAQPLVSIVVPVYNGARYLRESLDSIVGQSYDNIEVLVMDDASTDDTGEIAGSYGALINYHRQPRNLGQFANAQEGIDRAQGEFVAVFHADDRYEREIIEREVELFRRFPELGAVFALDYLMDNEGRDYGLVRLPAGVPGNTPLPFATVLNALLEHRNHILRTPGALVRTSVYRELGGFDEERFGVSADFEMWLRISGRYPIAVLPEQLFHYRHFHDNVTQAYQSLRTHPHVSFQIMDGCLRDGGRRYATARALAAYEAHRMEDRLMCAMTAYVTGDMAVARSNLHHVKVRSLVGSDRVQRWRLLILYVLLRVLCTMPRIQVVADVFSRRWHRHRDQPPRRREATSRAAHAPGALRGGA